MVFQQSWADTIIIHSEIDNTILKVNQEIKEKRTEVPSLNHSTVKIGLAGISSNPNVPTYV